MSDARPNIIFIITDQQRYDTIAALGYPHMDTPNLDKLVNEGVSFSHCYITAASCAPARASLFTGHYPHTTGILKNADEWTHSWVENLSESGYLSVNVGKMHTWPFTVPCGFHQRYVVENKDRYLEGRYFFDEWDKALAARGLVKQQRELYRERSDYREALGSFTWDLPEDMQSDNFVGGMAKWWIRQYPPKQPLFLQIGFPGPHPPYDPTPDALAEYADRDVPIDPIEESDLENQPTAYREMRVHNNEVDHDSVVLDLDPSEEQRLRQRRHYCANVSMIDKQIGDIFDALEEGGYLDNSIVIFTGDHGDCLTDHGHSQKWTMYEQVVRVPLIVWTKDGRFGKGRSVDELVSLFDLGPTILEMAECEVPADYTAETLMPALKEEREWKGRKAVFAEQPRDGNFTAADYQVMVRTEKWKLVEIYGADQAPGGREGLLFDLENDSLEKQNLWDDQAHREVRQELRDAILDWRIETGHRASKAFAKWR
ncbi:MAG: arylsulfatase [Verrucomicrobiales bacterium]|nr:arylsulfatase [Verrucomicrobiales bacterium]